MYMYIIMNMGGLFMKLILAIVSDDDSVDVSSALINNKFQVTKLASTGGFLSMGNTTIIVGCEDNLVEQAIEIIGTKAKRRTEIAPATTSLFSSEFPSMPINVTVGGATIFVLNIDQFVKL